MYCLHKPGDGHQRWKEKKEKSRREKRDKDKASSATQPAAGGDAKKLASAQSLQTALVSKAGLSEDAFQHLWNEACKESGNC